MITETNELETCLTRSKLELLIEIDLRAEKYSQEIGVKTQTAKESIVDVLTDIVSTGCDDEYKLDSMIREYINEYLKRNKGG